MIYFLYDNIPASSLFLVMRGELNDERLFVRVDEIYWTSSDLYLNAFKEGRLVSSGMIEATSYDPEQYGDKCFPDDFDWKSQLVLELL